MAHPQQPSGIRHLPRALGEISGYAVAILAYLLALVGQPPAPFAAFPATISLLTIFASVGAQWLWRWPKIAAGRPAAPPARPARRGRSHPARPPGPGPTQRRVELAALSALTGVSLGLAGFRATAVAEEISGFHCANELPGAPSILVANFIADADGFGDSLANVMVIEAGARFRVCRYNRSIALGDEAEAVGERFGATLVVWGNSSERLAEVYMTAIDWAMLTRRDASLGVSGSREGILLLAEHIVAEILFAEGKVAEAQASIVAAVREADTPGMAAENPALLSDSYFLLGLLLDPGQLPDEQLGRPRQAIFAYSRAIALDPQLDSAYLNRALLYGRADDVDAALADYSALIARDSRFLLEALLARGQLLLQRKSYPAAIADFVAVREHPLVDPQHPLYVYAVHFLGKAYLLNGDYALAEHTYEGLTALSAEDADYIVDDLNSVVGAARGPEARATIAGIITRARGLPEP